MFSIEPLSDILGARITGLDLSGGVTQTDFNRALQALHEHGFIVLPRQTLTPAQFVAFSALWGRPEPHVIDTYHHPADANILILSNVYRDGKPIGLVDAGTYFHTDYSYLDIPARCTILHALQVPHGREGTTQGTTHGTTFANQRQAYQDLPEKMKRRIEGLVGRHHYGNRDDLDETSRTVASVLTLDQKKKVTWVHHRIARPHPHTGMKALYAVSGSSFGIEGIDDGEARTLLDELKAHATQPRYLYTHEYAVGDVIVWDNAQLLHSAPLTHCSEARTLWRITIKESART